MAAKDLLDTNGPEGVLALVPLALIPLLLLLLLGVYRKNMAALGLAIFVVPVLWLIELSMALTAITGSERFGENPDTFGKIVGWGSTALVMLVYIRELIQSIRNSGCNAT